MWNVLFKPVIGKPMTIFRPSLELSDRDEVRHTTKVIKIRHFPFSDKYVCTTESGKTYEIVFLKKVNKIIQDCFLS